ncbi:putative conidiation-specific protein Con-10 [Zychaea mexicana]|uniref:putative conidiation-specific protein Con-10 n=1 Tax=Zychaea mexicana TaxID=64656 RepID=UPI0022FE48EE|nr:putative conidiation-specific protein Con-10 [Zychaea mexicana]KAI9498038.1 putative conidiation-specific protein Con-10 [Zychaea mexicana]
MSNRQNNPANFANRSKEEVQNIASKGGQSSHSGGFASMDSQKQHDISSQGGQASSGSFEPGSERARAAGRKGGRATGNTNQTSYEEDETYMDDEQ